MKFKHTYTMDLAPDESEMRAEECCGLFPLCCSLFPLCCANLLCSDLFPLCCSLFPLC